MASTPKERLVTIDDLILLPHRREQHWVLGCEQCSIEERIEQDAKTARIIREDYRLLVEAAQQAVQAISLADGISWADEDLRDALSDALQQLGEKV